LHDERNAIVWFLKRRENENAKKVRLKEKRVRKRSIQRRGKSD